MCADNVYSSARRVGYGGHRDENTHREYYAPRNPGTNGQSSLGVYSEKLSTIGFAP